MCGEVKWWKFMSPSPHFVINLEGTPGSPQMQVGAAVPAPHGAGAPPNTCGVAVKKYICAADRDYPNDEGKVSRPGLTVEARFSMF